MTAITSHVRKAYAEGKAAWIQGRTTTNPYQAGRSKHTSAVRLAWYEGYYNARTAELLQSVFDRHQTIYEEVEIPGLLYPNKE